MLYATKIRFKQFEQNAGLKTIKDIWIEKDLENGAIDSNKSFGWIPKEDLHDLLVENAGLIIEVKNKKTSKRPPLIPAEDGTITYVKSEKDETKSDNLLELPIETN